MIPQNKIKPIKTSKDYKEALALIEEYFDSKAGTAEGMFLEVLSILVEKYEEEHFPIENPKPLEAIQFRMEQLGLTNDDLAKVLGGKNRVSEVMNKKRGLSLAMVRNLHRKWKIPAESLIGT